MHGELEQAKIGEAEMARINKEIWALPGSIVVVKNRQGSWSVSSPGDVGLVLG